MSKPTASKLTITGNESIFTFKTGETIYADDISEASTEWLKLAWPVAKGAHVKPERIVDALLLTALIATSATQETGGVPLNFYLASGGAEGATPIMPAPNIVPESELSPFSAALVGASIYRMTKASGHRFVSHVGPHIGQVRVASTPEEAGSRELPDGEPADMLLSITTFDTHTDEVARWWLRVEHTGDYDKPLHLRPLNFNAHEHELFDWDQHWDTNARQASPDATIGSALPPGVERVEDATSLRGQLDLRLMRLAQSIGSPDNLDPEAQAETMRQLGINHQQLTAMVVSWLRELHEMIPSNEVDQELLEALEENHPSSSILIGAPVKA
jgi:hypothetical protein